MKQRLEQSILVAIAVVTGATSFGFDVTTAAWILALLNVALAVCAGLR